jgi:cyclophilin family peptidyl-prolyl cis-trans isomerase
MTFSRRSRRVPPKARGPRPESRPVDPAAGAAGAAGGAGLSGATGPGDAPGATPPADRTPGVPVRGTRSANRAAKRAASGVRPKAVRGGPVRGRRSRSFSPAVIGLAIAAVAVGAGVLLIGNPFGNPLPSPTTPVSAAPASLAVYGDGTCPTSQPAPLPAGQSRLVTIETEEGEIGIRVDGALSPIATGNFVALAECEYYDGVVFHRLVPGFVIQGGDPNGTGSGPGPGYGIQDEPITGTYRRGTVAMARTGQPNSQGSQFFIVLDDQAAGALTNVDPTRGYAILGEVITGMDVVDAIAAMPNSGGQENRALEPVAMTRVTVGPAPAASASPAPPAASPSAAAASPATSP